MDLDTAFKNSTLLADLVSDIVLMQNTWKVSSHGPAQTKKSESIRIENRTQRTMKNYDWEEIIGKYCFAAKQLSQIRTSWPSFFWCSWVMLLLRSWPMHLEWRKLIESGLQHMWFPRKTRILRLNFGSIFDKHFARPTEDSVKSAAVKLA